MKTRLGKRVISFLLVFLLLFGAMPAEMVTAETNDGAFILAVETAETLVIAPEYVYYKEGDTIGAALQASGHDFVGLEEGIVTEIDGVTGNYTRCDEDGEFDLTKLASEVEYYRFSEETETDSLPTEGHKLLMTAMAEYLLKESDVQAAAKEEYETASKQFLGIDSDSAKYLAEQLNAAIDEYESTLSGTQYSVFFSNGSSTYSNVNITMENEYGKIWIDDGDGQMQVPAGNYTFVINHNGLRAEGAIIVSANVTVTAALPESLWIDLSAFRMSGSYGVEDNEDGTFNDDEFALGEWTDRQITVPVTDTFTGAIYTYVKYNADLFETTPTLTAVYKTAKGGEEVEKKLPFESLTSGATDVLTKGATGNTVIYRVSSAGSDGYTYSQDYTVTFDRIPTLSKLSVKDQDGTDQVADRPFDGDVTDYVYKVVDTVTDVTINAVPLDESYIVKVNGTDLGEGVTVALDSDEETNIAVEVSAGDYSNTYNLAIRPGEGKNINFKTSSADVTLEVVNSNNEVIPFIKHKEGDYHRYQYTLVPGETYSYVATTGTYYHLADQFTIEEVENSTITVEVPTEDWMTDLAFGTAKAAKNKGNLGLDTAFVENDHNYQVEFVDTEHLAYIWVTGNADTTIKAIYNQVFASDLYHGKEYTIELISGYSTGEQLKRFLMDENPIENTVTIRLSKEVDGVTQYQDYVVDFNRSLTLSNISAKCDGVTASLIQEDGTIGFDAQIKEYSVTVSMAANALELTTVPYTENTCSGEDNVGYQVFVDGTAVSETNKTEILLDGTIGTQDVTVTVKNDKAPNGTTEYIIHILKSPPVETKFEITPEDALLTIYETISGERLWTNENGTYNFCEGYKYQYALTQYGYVSKTGILDVTRDEEENLVVADGTELYTVTETEAGGGTATITWTLEEANENTAINPDLSAKWANFRGNEENNAVTDAPVPTAAEEGTLYWANQIGEGIDADAVGSPILVDDVLITYAGDTIYRVDTVTGDILSTGTMDHKSSFAITPPSYSDGMVFVALSNGTVQAFNAVTLESLWIYRDPLGGQPNCPLTIKDGYLYTGFWNSESGEANFICLSITDENITSDKEEKCASWYYTQLGGYYWAGAYVNENYLLVGTDDGTSSYTSQTSRMLLFDSKTGVILDSLEGLNGDVRSTVVYDSATDAYYFTAKGGSFYGVKVTETEEGTLGFSDFWSLKLQNGGKGVAMSTSSPVVYNGRAYIGVSGAGQFSAYSGHNISVIDLNKHSLAYSINTQGYPQTSGLLTTAYEEESGYVYVYFFDNMTPGKLRVLRDKAGQTKADYVTTEGDYISAYALFTPTGDQAQYAICSPVVDEYGTIYFKNDSAYLMAYGSKIEKIEVTTEPNQMVYEDGDSFNPEGMVVTATYSNGTTRDVTDYVTYSHTTITEGETELTLTFKHVMYHNAEDGTSMTSGVKSSTPVTSLTVSIGEVENPEPTPVTGRLGDVNLDGSVEIDDANLVASYYNEVINLTEEQLAVADVNGDGSIDIADANLIASYYNEEITSFPAENK